MKFFPFLISILVFGLLACTDQGNQRQEEMERFRNKDGKVKVLSTIAMIGDLVKQVGDGYVDSLTLLRGNLDPHSYQLVKGDDEKLAYADIVFYNGLGLEHGPSLQHYLETHHKAIGLGNKVMEQDSSLILPVEGQLDPHIWMDVSLWAKTVPFIIEALSAKDPSHAEEFRANGKKVTQDLLQTHQYIHSTLESIPSDKRFLVTSHDAFNYFTKAYLATEQERMDGTWRKRFAAPEGLAPESQLSASHIQQIIDYLALYKIHVIFPESNVSKDSIRKIISAGKEKGLDIVIAPCCLYADAMGEPGSKGDTYQKMVTHNADWIIKYLKVN
jgi:manganese/zinc/iron transport system substrate-binding protein